LVVQEGYRLSSFPFPPLDNSRPRILGRRRFNYIGQRFVFHRQQDLGERFVVLLQPLGQGFGIFAGLGFVLGISIGEFSRGFLNSKNDVL
jgi:hypothetical protein